MPLARFCSGCWVVGVPNLVLGAAFVLAAAISVATSWVLVVRLERVGARLGLSEALLGMLAALAADAPEITAAVTALVRHDERVGAGVVIGSNVLILLRFWALPASWPARSRYTAA